MVVSIPWLPFLASLGTMVLRRPTWSELLDLVERVEAVEVDIELEHLIDLELLPVLLSQASNTLGQSGAGSIVDYIYWL